MSIVAHGEAARESGGAPFHYPQLTATNYISWVIRVQAMMEDQGVWEAIEPAVGAAVDTKKDKKARSHLFQALPEDLLMQVAMKKTAKEVWDCLKTRFIGADRVKNARLQTLKNDFDVIRMQEGETLDQYAGRLNGMSIRYANLGATLDEAALVKKLFDTVPDHFLSVIAGIEQFYDLDTMPFEEAVGRLKAYEERTRPRTSGGNSSSDGQLLLTQDEWQTRQKKDGGDSSSNNKGKSYAPENSSNYGRSGRGRSRGRGRGGRGWAPNKNGASGSNGGGRDKSHIRCFNCDKMGHYASECRAPKKEEEAHLTRADDTEPALMLAVSEEMAPKQRERRDAVLLSEEQTRPEEKAAPCHVWYLDNGASNHMTGDRAKFRELDENVTGKVKFGDDSTVQIMGKGSILFGCRNGDQWLLQEVYYIPRLRSNIVSLGQLTETGHKVIMVEDALQVLDKNHARLLMKVRRTANRLYKIELHQAEAVCLLANLEDPAWLWHARLGHVNFNAMKLLVDKEMAVGVPPITHPNQLCQGCLVAKQARQPFPVAANYRAEKPLELLHADLCGPITPSSLAGNSYFMLIVDDYSRWMWLYVIKTKDQACSAFRRFKLQVENTSERRIKTLRTDRGGEFLSAEFNRLCEEAGIKRHLTAPYTPQQNGVVERKNRTVMAMARSLLKSMNVPGSFWGEAVRHAVYLLNRLPTKALGERTPFEAWNGRKPHLAHLRVFGCTAHAKVTTAHLKKLDDRSQPMMYLGIEDGCKAHRLFDPRRGKIHVSRDVIFEEKAEWCWSTGTGGGDPSDFVVKEECGTEPTEDNFAPPADGLAGESAPATQVHPAPSSTPLADKVSPGGPETRARAAAHTTASSPSLTSPMVMTSTGSLAGDLATPNSVVGTPLSCGSSSTDHGHVRYRHIDDIMRDARRVQLDEEDMEEEAMLVETEEPSCYREAAGQQVWEDAMAKEIESIEKNKTWSLMTLPAGHKPIGLKWVYKLKKNSDGDVIKHKARLVAKGYVQRQGIDFEEVFAPVARLDTVRVILAIAANRGWQIHHLDVKSAFLNGELEEEVYVAQPEGFTVKNKEHLVLKLSKALYGLRQAPRAWNIRLDRSLKQLGFVKCAQEQAVYTRGTGRARVIIGVYVDDLIVTGEDPGAIAAFKRQMMSEFEMSDLGLLNFYLGIEVKQEEDGITIKQETYAKKVLTQFGMVECNPTKYPMEPRSHLYKDPDGQPVDATEYRRVIGCLRYLLHTRPDLSFVVGVLSRFMERPTVMHHKVVKQILRYVKGTVGYGLVYPRGEEAEVITGYTDSNLAGDNDDRKSTGGMAFYVNECLVSWNSQKQKTVALSSCEAEFMAATAAACQALWLRNLLNELTGKENDAVKLFVDNKSAIALMKNPVFHGRSKHIDMRFHFIRECVEGGQIVVEFVRTDEQRADSLTKALPAAKLATMRHLLGVRNLGPHQD